MRVGASDSEDDDVYSDALEDVEGGTGAAEDLEEAEITTRLPAIGVDALHGAEHRRTSEVSGDVNVRSANRPKIRSVERLNEERMPVTFRCCFASLYNLFCFSFCLCHRDRAGSVRESHRGDIGAQRVGKCGVDAHLGREFIGIPSVVAHVMGYLTWPPVWLEAFPERSKLLEELGGRIYFRFHVARDARPLAVKRAVDVAVDIVQRRSVSAV